VANELDMIDLLQGPRVHQTWHV